MRADVATACRGPPCWRSSASASSSPAALAVADELVREARRRAANAALRTHGVSRFAKTASLDPLPHASPPRPMRRGARRSRSGSGAVQAVVRRQLGDDLGQLVGQARRLVEASDGRSSRDSGEVEIVDEVGVVQLRPEPKRLDSISYALLKSPWRNAATPSASSALDSRAASSSSLPIAPARVAASSPRGTPSTRG